MILQSIPVKYHFVIINLLPCGIQLMKLSQSKVLFFSQNLQRVVQILLDMLWKGVRNIQKFSGLKLVLLRHGQSQCNLIKKWSGWFNAQLTPKGQTQATQCGKILLKEGFQFDLAYCSVLSRTIKTLNIILDVMDCHYLPVRKCWQLNEKFYGALQELNKLEIVDKYGQQMVSQWRRSYEIAPPKVFSQDPRHPWNDKKYKDVDPNLLPSTEHLGDVLERVRSLYETEILQKLKQGKRLIIVCHGSTLRAWTNILLGFSYTQSSKFNIPTGTPLVVQFDKNLSVKQWKILGDQKLIQKKMKNIQNELKKE